MAYRRKAYSRDRGRSIQPPQSYVSVNQMNRIQIGNSYSIEPTIPYVNQAQVLALTAGDQQTQVRIKKVVRCDDPLDEFEEAWCLIMNGRDHLRTLRVDLDGVVIDGTGKYLAVVPNGTHTISEFSPVAWDITDMSQPVFMVFAHVEAIVSPGIMSFGQGEKWVSPPTNICQGNGDDDPFGACCQSDGTCSDTNQGDCPAGVGEWKGAGTTCADDPDPCIQCIGPGCDDLGICCCEDTADCYNDLYPSPSCWSNATEAECLAGGGSWDNTKGSQCPAGTCADPPVSGTCCVPFSGSGCIIASDEKDCGLQGGSWEGHDSCDTSACPQPLGSCCINPGDPNEGCIDNITLDICNSNGGKWNAGPCVSATECP